jgi:D-beta-D-heptose 7-phosphate kinase/D-beta-D-heptose 1-phosphate adenosyltransferase
MKKDSPLSSPALKSSILEAIHRFERCRVLVLGDVMLDVFVWGKVRRISPEAPVPVVEVREETKLLGGAANVVHNLATLKGKVSIAGLIGSDSSGRDVVKLFRQNGVSTAGLIVEESRPTSVKTRIIAHNQQVVRFDREHVSPIERDSQKRALSYICKNLDQVDAIIISDYGKGMVTSELMDAIRSISSSPSLPIIVDPKVNHTDCYHDVFMITPNELEASQMSGIEIKDEETLIQAGGSLMDRLQCQSVLVTRGEEGMSLFQRDQDTVHIPTVARRVYDVTGAGDTVIATITLGIIAGLSPVESAILANLAAGIVVGEVGTATVLWRQLLSVVENGRLP